jgi:outer membrane protein
MKRTALLPLLALVALLFATPAAAGPGFDVGARAYYWFPKMTGTVVTMVGAITDNTEFNVKDDLGVQDENIAAGEAFARIGRFRFRAGYTPLNFTGDKVLTRDIVFQGQTFSVGAPVHSKLDLKTIDGEIGVDILRPEVPVLANAYVGLLAKVKYVDGQVELTTTGTREVRDFHAPIPMVGAQGGIGVLGDWVRLDAKVAGIAYSGKHLYEGDIYASFSPVPFVKLQGGYRAIDLKYDDNDFKAALKIKGPYVGLQAAF